MTTATIVIKNDAGQEEERLTVPLQDLPRTLETLSDLPEGWSYSIPPGRPAHPCSVHGECTGTPREMDEHAAWWAAQ